MFDTLYYGNTIVQWLIALGLIVVSFLAARLIYWIFKNWLKLLVRRTRLQIDDLLIDNAEEPVVLLIIIYGIRFSLETLSFPPAAARAVQTGALFLSVVSLTWLIARFYDTLHKQYVAPLASQTGTNLDDQLLPVVRTGVRFIVWTLGIIIALNNAGYNVGAILAGLGIGGLAFALAAQDTISNIFGGLTILLQHPFQLDDIIIFEGRWLVVKQIGLRASLLIDFDTDHYVIIPNSKFTSSVITNVSRSPGHIKELTLHLSPATHSAQLTEALDLLKAVVSENAEAEHVLTRLDRFDPGAIVILFIYRIKAFGDRHRVITEVNAEIMRRFEGRGIRLALPAAIRVSDTFEGGVFG